MAITVIGYQITADITISQDGFAKFSPESYVVTWPMPSRKIGKKTRGREPALKLRV